MNPQPCAAKPGKWTTARSPSFPKKRWLWAAGLTLATLSSGACAQSVWTYELIGADNRPSISYKPPNDISYPSAGQPVPISTSGARREIRLTPEEVAARRRAPMLIIVLGPARS